MLRIPIFSPRARWVASALSALLLVALGLPKIARAEASSDPAAVPKAGSEHAAETTTAADIAALRRELAELRAATAPATAPVASGPNAFNPAISLILSGGYTRTSQDPAQYAITGFFLPAAAEAGPGTRGFSLAESELGFAANIDPWWRGAVNLALHGDDTVSVEEAFIQTTGLGHGLGFKAGRYFSGVGYLNSQHAHAWDFADNPLAYQAMLGTQYGDDGVQLTWLAPSDQFIELGAELGRGRGFPGGDNSRNGAGMVALTAHSGGDIGESHSWRAGVSVLNAKATDQALQGADAEGQVFERVFSGSTRVWVADALWKWAPDGNATRTSFKLQGEVLQSKRTGSLANAADGAPVGLGGDRRQTGAYVQGVYQFLPGWRLGLRTERLDAGGSTAPTKQSAMLDFNASEFTRVRLQWALDRSRQGAPDHQLILQYQMSLGAHGAHRY